MKKRIFLLLPLLFAFTAVTFAQVPCIRSRVQIPDTLYNTRAGLFDNNSRIQKQLKKHYGKPHPLSVGTFQLDNFFQLLGTEPSASGLKIYFGSFDETGNATDDGYANGNHNMIFPIFVLTKADGSAYHRDFGSYYIFDLKTKSVVPVQKSSAQTWYDHFKYGMDMLKEEVHTLWYDTADLNTWRRDILCQQQTNAAIKTITMKWGVYEKDIVDPVKKKMPIKKGALIKKTIPTTGRLLLLFYIPNAISTKEFDAVKGAYDTAVPCPPGSNCDGDELK
ncbi:MAG: hypothetical protein V4557_19990 [Bacteroidota bacterium]